ncbi:MAG: DNA polymerase I [Candidatus Omnitrophica bacterium]|jgi:DNA polymerase-1|nr:DNA polymerase I [Candidatus Omnitrophota bacterium]
MSEKRLYLLDATAFCYRAYYALTSLATSFGQPTNAIYGFINIINKILKDNNPEYLAVCFDVSRETFRTKKFAEYKINRPPMPDGLSSQIPFIKDIVKAYGITIVEKAGFEADDIIASLSSKAKEEGMPVMIVSSDKDILQLVDENTSVFSPYKDIGTLYDRDKVLERFGIMPEQIPELIALMGDQVDNIPSIPGIGEKTASSLIKQFGTVKKILSDLEAVTPERIRESIRNNSETVELNHELALLDKKVSLDIDLEQLKINSPDYPGLLRIFKQLEFKKFLKTLPAAPGEQEAETEVVVLKDKDLAGLLKPVDELFLTGDSAEKLIFCVKDKIFRIENPGEVTKKILADAKIKKISHDLKKLKVTLAKEKINLEGLYFDTLIAAYVLNPSKAGYSLTDLAWDYLSGAPEEKTLGGVAAMKLILALRHKLEEELKEKSLFKLFQDTEMPLAEVLAQIELTGIKLDLPVLEQLDKDLGKRLKELIEGIYKLSAIEFNINSPKQLREILFEKLKLRVVKKTKTGPSTDEEVLRVLAETHELPKLLLEYRQLTKLKNTYIDALPALVDPLTGRVHTWFNQAGTETGRLSSNNPNLQNIPIKTEIGSRIRKAIIAFDKKSVLLSCDYSQIELRILAHLSGDDNLIQAFIRGDDIHKATAALIYNVEEKDVNDEMRVVAKRINFGIVYGLSSWGLARDLKLPVEEAQVFIDAYFIRYPGVKEYIESQIALAKKQKFVSTILGRRRYLPEIDNKNQAVNQLAQRQAVNTPIQGSASDLIKLAMIRIAGCIEEKKLNSKMILQIHDELLFNVPENDLDSFTALAKDSMENVLKLNVPVRVSMKKGKNWLEMEEIK